MSNTQNLAQASKKLLFRASNGFHITHGQGVLPAFGMLEKRLRSEGIKKAIHKVRYVKPYLQRNIDNERTTCKIYTKSFIAQQQFVARSLRFDMVTPEAQQEPQTLSGIDALKNHPSSKEISLQNVIFNSNKTNVSDIKNKSIYSTVKANLEGVSSFDKSKHYGSDYRIRSYVNDNNAGRGAGAGVVRQRRQRDVAKNMLDMSQYL